MTGFGVLVRKKTGQFCFVGPGGVTAELVDGDQLEVELDGERLQGVAQIEDGRNRLMPADIPLDFIAGNAWKVRKSE